jgi:hypothetical protein
MSQITVKISSFYLTQLKAVTSPDMGKALLEFTLHCRMIVIDI